MKNLVARFVKDESGATAIEYGLIAAGISLVIITAVNSLGTNLNTKFTNINASLKFLPDGAYSLSDRVCVRMKKSVSEGATAHAWPDRSSGRDAETT
eukprot:gene66203-90612_t